MGLFDDIMGLAKDINELKSEATDVANQVMGDVSSLKDEATEAVTSLRDEASSVKSDIVNNISLNTSSEDTEK